MGSRPVPPLVRSLLAGVALGLTACRPGAPIEPARLPNPLLVEQGAATYLRYCASCHGVSAVGDGPAAPALRMPPADLTRIAARRDGVFPDGDIASYIDGRLSTVAHGTREMPIWGTQLRQEIGDSDLAEEVVRGRITMLVDFLKTIQRPGEE